MKSSQHKIFGKKGMSTEMIFLVSLFGIVLILSVFYVWIQKNITDLTKEQADTIGADVERRVFFSELIHAHGQDIANKDEGDVEDIIENFARNYLLIEKGGYVASCSTEAEERTCTLEITDDLKSGIWMATFFIPYVGPYSLAAYVLMKALSLDILDQTKTSAYLPAYREKIMRFTLDITVEFA